jgi:2-polyprenyl-6-hydroxyphenyl methylase/3-demethylubiquinone-9 3-methyltransferase
MPVRRDVGQAPVESADLFDHTSDPNFLAYYARESQSVATLNRFRTVRDKSLSLLQRRGYVIESLKVADIGCGAGTQSLLWAELGHVVNGLDVNAPLIEVARKRAAEAGFSVHFNVGTATALPYSDDSMDVCLLPELLEHVPDWQACLNEAVRVLKPGGLLYLSTTNALCPFQQEFRLPAYSWYPAFLKRYYERLAVTTRPEIANFAKYPAVHWFTFYELREYLEPKGFECLDRFEMIPTDRCGTVTRLMVRALRAVSPARLVAHAMTEGTTIFALKGTTARP